MKTKTLILKNTVLGIMLGFTIMTISLTLTLLIEKDVNSYLTKEVLLTNILWSAIVGIVFYVGSIVYRYDKIAAPLQITIHMGSGLIVFAIAAYFSKWMPIEAGPLAIILFIIIALIVSFGIWFGYYLYYKNEAQKINKEIKNRQ